MKQEETTVKQVYILLSRTGTVPSYLIHKMTPGTFTHTSLALTPETDRFYSYARRTLHNPLNAGIILEDIHDFVFAQYPNCHCALFALEVSDEGYERIRARIEHYLQHYKKAKYNFLGIVPLRMGIRIPRKFRLVCSQFVAVALSAAEELALPKDPYLMLPNDFPKIETIRKIYEGPLKDCRFDMRDSAPTAG